MTPIRSSNDENNCLSFGVWSGERKKKKNIICLCNSKTRRLASHPYMLWRRSHSVHGHAGRRTENYKCHTKSSRSRGCLFPFYRKTFGIDSKQYGCSAVKCVWFWLVAVWGPPVSETESHLRTTDQTTDFSAIFEYKFVDNDDDDNNDQPTEHPIRTSHHFHFPSFGC